MSANVNLQSCLHRLFCFSMFSLCVSHEPITLSMVSVGKLKAAILFCRRATHSPSLNLKLLRVLTTHYESTTHYATQSMDTHIPCQKQSGRHVKHSNTVQANDLVSYSRSQIPNGQMFFCLVLKLSFCGGCHAL